jgi:hypothetical protein
VTIRTDAFKEQFMNSKTLTGTLLIIGPIIMAVTIFAGFPGNSGNEDWVTADYITEIAANIGLHKTGTLVELAAIIAMMTGWIFLAQSMHQNGKPGSLFGKVATILPLICLPIAVASSGLAMSVAWAIEDNLMTEAGMLWGAAEGMSTTVFNVVGISWILLGIGIILQKNLHLVLAILLIIIGAAMFLMNIVGGFLWIPGFLGFLILSLATGILTVINRNTD